VESEGEGAKAAAKAAAIGGGGGIDAGRLFGSIAERHANAEGAARTSSLALVDCRWSMVASQVLIESIWGFGGCEMERIE
jgi:hypothetical protein